MSTRAPYRAVRLGDLTPEVEARTDGSRLLRARQPLGAYPDRYTERLAHWARVAPDRTLLAWREGERWQHLAFAQAFDLARRIGQALIDRGLNADRPLAILSGNDREHLLLTLAAQHVGVPVAPISPAYSLVSRDFGMLTHAIGLLTPGLVYAADERFRPAIEAVGAIGAIGAVGAVIPAGTEVLVGPTDLQSALLDTEPSGDVDRAHAAISPDAVAKILFTSGSTGLPKGVINTHRMLCSNQQMILQALPFLADAPPVLVDWLPWHHTFGGNHNVGLVLYNGGSLYLDEGRPLPGLFDQTVRNLREIAPTIYLNVPKGYEELSRALGCEPGLADRFFSRLQLLFYAAASLSQHVSDELHAIAERTCGERLVFVTGLGATETAPMAICRPWGSDLASAIGLPVPGVEVKLVPTDEKLAVWVRGPNVTPGFWRQDALTRAAFDADGFYGMGDAVRLADPEDITQGLVFDGRIAEDFKLSTGTWVNVGPLRAKIVAHFAPYIRDALITGHDRNEVGMLAVPDPGACGCLADLSPIQERLDAFAASATGSATRVARAMLMEEPPSLDGREITDKGSLNQRAMLARRASLVDELYADPPSARVLVAR